MSIITAIAFAAASIVPNAATIGTAYAATTHDTHHADGQEKRIKLTAEEMERYKLVEERPFDTTASDAQSVYVMHRANAPRMLAGHCDYIVQHAFNMAESHNAGVSREDVARYIDNSSFNGYKRILHLLYRNRINYTPMAFAYQMGVKCIEEDWTKVDADHQYSLTK